MTPEQVLQEFEAAGALLKGHFVLSSGLHSDTFLQKALVFQNAETTAKLCRALAEKVRAAVAEEITAIVSPAVGGIVPGYEMGRQMGLPAMYVERENKQFILRRGFRLEPGQKVLMVEDIVTTGLSSRECLEAIRVHGGVPVAASCVIDRSGGAADVGVPLISLAALKLPTWPADRLPPHLQGTPAVKPGSRGLV
jgi:orotate phosphoribosyltransferase